ncbi:MAG TPA: hypothetical protein VFA20_31370 [Myxococcaceae bacterium]|nr:hypothetical protein [Myxococcaceae bacterium]
MRILLATAGEDLFAFDPKQMAGVLAWPLTLYIPWRSLHELADVSAPEPEPRLLLSRSRAEDVPFAVRVPGPLREEDVPEAEIFPLPPLLAAPPWVRALVSRGGSPALLLDLPLLGDTVVALPQLPLPETIAT